MTTFTTTTFKIETEGLNMELVNFILNTMFGEESTRKILANVELLIPVLNRIKGQDTISFEDMTFVKERLYHIRAEVIIKSKVPEPLKSNLERFITMLEDGITEMWFHGPMTDGEADNFFGRYFPQLVEDPEKFGEDMINMFLSAYPEIKEIW